MSEADKLFEELGYEKEIYQNEEKFGGYVSYAYSNDKIFIEFNGFANTLYIGNNDKENTSDIHLSMQEIKAINMKCKELRME